MIQKWNDFTSDIKKVTYEEYSKDTINMTPWTKTKFKSEFRDHFLIHNWEVRGGDCVRGSLVYSDNPYTRLYLTIVQKPNKEFCIETQEHTSNSGENSWSITREYWHCNDYDSAVKFIYLKWNESPKSQLFT